MWQFIGLLILALLFVVPGFYRVVYVVAGVAAIGLVAIIFINWNNSEHEKAESAKPYGARALRNISYDLNYGKAAGMGWECTHTLSTDKANILVNRYVEKIADDHAAIDRVSAAINGFHDKKIMGELAPADMVTLCEPFADEMTRIENERAASAASYQAKLALEKSEADAERRFVERFRKSISREMAIAYARHCGVSKREAEKTAEEFTAANDGYLFPDYPSLQKAAHDPPPGLHDIKEFAEGWFMNADQGSAYTPCQLFIYRRK